MNADEKVHYGLARKHNNNNNNNCNKYAWIWTNLWEGAQCITRINDLNSALGT